MSARDVSFDDLPITDRARDAAHALGWRTPTPIQAAAIPQLAARRDVIARAETGSGKTGAFGLILTDAVKAPGVRALVLAPTRELAQQIASDLNALAVGAPFRAVAIHGGVPMDPQYATFADPSTTCVVATTGRMLDLLARRPDLLKQVEFVILDEADRMLDLGFLPEVERVLRHVGGPRQTALFTATMPKKVAELARKYMAHPREVEVGSATPSTAEHRRVDIASSQKFESLVTLLERERPRRALVFARTRADAHDLAERLAAAGLAARAFSGDLDQVERERVVADLREERATLVVATDVAARGLDIDGITHVINYDAPEEPDAYVHRAGRTARAGRQGRVFTLVTEHDGARIAAAEKAAGVRLQPFSVGAAGAPARPPPSARPPPPMRGGYARGAKRRKAPTPPRPQKAPKETPEVTRTPEGGLPPSRRERRRDAPESDE